MIQQQVEVLKFEDIYISKFKAKALKTNKLRDWLALLKAYQQNSNFQEKDEAIKMMHSKFVLNEEFWIFEINRKRESQNWSEKDIDFIFLAIEDGHVGKVPQMISEILSSLLHKANQNMGSLRVNYLIAKVEKLISMCSRPKNYYPILKNHYKQANNQKKTRETYLREIRFGYDNHDVVYDEYRLWEKNNAELQKSNVVYEHGKNSWQLWNESGVHDYHELTHVDQSSFDAFSYMSLISKLESKTDRLFYLRVVCLKRHELYLEYFETLQEIFSEDEEAVIESYQNLLDIIPQIQTSYLNFLVRRINKHIYSTQSKEYNDSWAENVQFFRQEITKLIEKERLTYRIRQSTQERYYQFWASVEAALVKDKDSISELFESLLKIKPTIDNYRRYSQALIQLGCIGDAKNVVRRCRQLYKIDYEAHELYMGFISIYGTLEDWIEFRKMKSQFADGRNKEEEKKAKANEEVKKSNGFHKQDLSQVSIQMSPITTNGIVTKASQQIEHNSKVPDEETKAETKPQTKQKEKEKGKGKGKETEKKVQISQNNHSDMEEKKKGTNQQQQARKKMYVDAGNTIFIKGFPSQWRQAEVTQIIKNKDCIKQIRLVEKGGFAQNFCYVDMNSAEDALKEINENEHKSKYVIAISNPPQTNREDKTLFLAGLPQSVTEDKVRQLFEGFSNDIVNVRLRMSQNKNIGYVDFSSQQKKSEALLKYGNRNAVIDDKKIIIKESNSKPAPAKKQLRVIILKQLAYKAKEKDIVEFFKDFSIEDVFIPEENGKSKGFAFVKFKTMDDYTQVLKMTKGVIKGRTFDIRKSDRDIQRPKVQKQQEVSNSFFSNLFK